MYAHLFRVVYGKLPERLEVLSLARGRMDIPFGERDVADAVTAVARARDEAGGEPAPAMNGAAAVLGVWDAMHIGRWTRRTAPTRCKGRWLK